MNCERCGKPATTVVAKADMTEKTNLCDECVKIVVRPGRGLYKVLEKENEGNS